MAENKQLLDGKNAKDEHDVDETPDAVSKINHQNFSYYVKVLKLLVTHAKCTG